MIHPPVDISHLSFNDVIYIQWSINSCAKYYLYKHTHNYKELLYAMAIVESSFGKNQYGKHNEIGLLQISPYHYNGKDEYYYLLNPFNNICKASKILDKLFTQYKSIVLALWRYNGNKKYANKVLNIYKKLLRRGNKL